MKRMSNMSALERELKKHILSSMQGVGRIGKSQLKKEVQEQVYSKHRPSTYQRTGDLKNSVTFDSYQIGSETYTDIFNNTEVIEPVKPYKHNNYMGQHYSTSLKYKPEEYNEYIVRTINDGTSGLIFGQGAWTKPRPFITNAKAYMELNFKKILKESLMRKGLNVK